MKRIGLRTNQISPGHQRLFEALGEILNFSLAQTTADNSSVDAEIVFGLESESESRVMRGDCPSYVVISDSQLVPCGESRKIVFGNHAVLPSILSGRQITSDEAVDLRGLPKWLEITNALVCKDGVSVWAIREYQRLCHHYVSMPIPELNEREPLFAFFNGKRFLSLLPLLLFLRSVTEDQRWEQPPLQASFMFDDANLHWWTYGFINFEQMLQHATAYNYHVSIATIPLDTWFVHKPTASLFREHRDRLSLLVHGNDHTAQELARSCTDRERTRILRQALRRMAELERRTGVEVSRVMAPPQGACSEVFLADMAQVGFEAACVSSGSLQRYNSQAKWLRTLGMRPSDSIGSLPVFPRFSLSRNFHNSTLVAALLHQPIIPMGHQQDLAEGLQSLDELSIFVNSLGAVCWADMKRISRSRYARMIDGRVLRVKMFSKHIDVQVPEGINEILVEQPWLPRTAPHTTVVWRSLGENSEVKTQGSMDSIPVRPGQGIEIASDFTVPLFGDQVALRRLRLWPILRRHLTEARDRVPPALHRILVRRR